MEITRNLLKKEEVLRYLGYQGTEIPPQTDRLINGCILEMKGLVRPTYCYRRYRMWEATEGIYLEESAICLTGDAIRRHLAGCKEVYLLCATVGMYVDKNIRLKMVMEPAAGAVLDSCGSVAVERVVEAVQQEIEKEVAAEGKSITGRFSPGYGDLPLTIQRDLAEELDVYRKLGVSVGENLMLSPSKSITAIIGVKGE